MSEFACHPRIELVLRAVHFLKCNPRIKLAPRADLCKDSDAPGRPLLYPERDLAQPGQTRIELAPVANTYAGDTSKGNALSSSDVELRHATRRCQATSGSPRAHAYGTPLSGSDRHIVRLGSQCPPRVRARRRSSERTDTSGGAPTCEGAIQRDPIASGVRHSCGPHEPAHLIGASLEPTNRQLWLSLVTSIQRATVRAMSYQKGMHEVAGGVWAYLQPDGGWGWSNAGLITDGDQSLLVDTLFDLKLTAEMLDAMRRTTPAAKSIDTLVNTHANGDHWYGNSLVEGAEIIASANAAAEMLELSPAGFAQMMSAAPTMGQTGAFLLRIFGSFDFEGIDVALPSRTFSGSLDLTVGDRRASLIEVGPAHTAGDVVVYLPAERVVFTGDILFHGGHPIVWAGPVSNWIAACDQILALDPAIVVPGHGPLAEPAAVADLKGYFEYLTIESRTTLRRRHERT